MIDQEKLAALKTSAHSLPKDSKTTLEDLDLVELEQLHEQISRLLPNRSLSDLNLESELLSQFDRIKQLQEDTLTDSDIPPNQRAQVASQVASTLQQLIKMQVELQLDEKLKKMEAALIEALMLLDEDARATFFTEYEQLAKKHGVF
jgi:hypothetical protein